MKIYSVRLIDNEISTCAYTVHRLDTSSKWFVNNDGTTLFFSGVHNLKYKSPIRFLCKKTANRFVEKAKDYIK